MTNPNETNRSATSKQYHGRTLKPSRCNFDQVCGAGTPAILHEWSRSQKVLDGEDEVGAWDLGSSSTALVCGARKITYYVAIVGCRMRT